VKDANKEIELDIDQLDQRTLLSLYRFVCPPVRRSHAAAPKSNRANPNKGGGTGGTKRKNLDEMKESQRIEMLEARLRDFENGAAGGGGAVATPVAAAGGEDQASSASSEEGSESESESDED
jgi:bromodomain-containing factor 1